MRSLCSKNKLKEEDSRSLPLPAIPPRLPQAALRTAPAPPQLRRPPAPRARPPRLLRTATAEAAGGAGATGTRASSP
jgi:hypothetical protein